MESGLTYGYLLLRSKPELCPELSWRQKGEGRERALLTKYYKSCSSGAPKKHLDDTGQVRVSKVETHV